MAGTSSSRAARTTVRLSTGCTPPDGAWIAYEAYPSVYSIPAHGGGKQRLVTSGLSAPAWSPDGKRLAAVEDQVMIKIVGLRTRTVQRFAVTDEQLGPDDVQTAPT